MKTMRRMGLLGLMTVALCLTLIGCKSGNARLEPGGAYAPVTTNADGTVTSHPDYAFYVVDSTFDTTYALLNGAFKFERDNRAALWKLDPNIKHTLDKIRPVAWDVVQRYSRARAVYIADPAPGNLGPLRDALARLEELTKMAAAAMPK